MNVSLTPELERLVQEKVSTGLYNSASEVVREALRLMQERDTLRRVRLDERRSETLGRSEADTLEEFEADMDRLAQGSEQIPVLPEDAFSRESIYAEHD